MQHAAQQSLVLLPAYNFSKNNELRKWDQGCHASYNQLFLSPFINQTD
jgi:hypothetical protein